MVFEGKQEVHLKLHEAGIFITALKKDFSQSKIVLSGAEQSQNPARCSFNVAVARNRKGSPGVRFGRQAVPSAGDHKEASHRVAQSGLRGLRDSGLIFLSFITFDGFVDFYFILRKKHKKNVYFKIDLKQSNTLAVTRFKAVKQF